jgi:RimJ/RimL family protein N-acetyltransferase
MTAELPERIELPAVGVVLRRYGVADIDHLYAAVEENRDHLRPHMPWADEGRSELIAFVTDAIAQWDRGADRNFAIVTADDEEYLGGCGLHDRIGSGGREVGYWLVAHATGRGIVTAAARALTDVALSIDGVRRVEIHCDEANARSAAVPRRLGFRLDRIEVDHVSAPGDLGRSMIWVWPDDRPRRSAQDASASAT